MTSAQVAVLPGGRAQVTPPAAPRRRSRLTGAVSFGALGLFGALRWGDLIEQGGTGRLVGLLIVSGALAVFGPRLAARSRLLAAPAALLAFLACLAVAGIPAAWIVHVRVGVIAQSVGEGLSALPRINVPYPGINPWIQLTLLLCAGMLLLAGALILTFGSRRQARVRRGAAAIPLLALAVIPATILRPTFPYLEGALLFVLLVGFVWGDRIREGASGALILPCVLAVAIALPLAPGIDTRRPWINYRALTSNLAAGGVEMFNWAQDYGPAWPHARLTVLDVQAAHPEYWKAENLDTFDGRGWTASVVPLQESWRVGISKGSLRRWSQTVQVTLRSMYSQQVIAAGSAAAPVGLPRGSIAATGPGTWQSVVRLVPGDSYRIRVYSPDPSRAQLAAAGVAYPQAIVRDELTLDLPDTAGVVPPVPDLPTAAPGGPLLLQLALPPFGPGRRAALAPGRPLRVAIAASPYARVFALSQRLETGASTPYAYLERVQRFLARGFTYNRFPVPSRYPLRAFLLGRHAGYCQHFAGAMALLLRMGGVPARVVAGFTPGLRDSNTNLWLISDIDAHAWVEAWFPHYGWVRFDPTPAADPALGGGGGSATGSGSLAGLRPQPFARRRGHRSNPVTTASAVRHWRARAGSAPADPLPWVVVGVVLILLLAGLAALTRERPQTDHVQELIRAYRRSGRPLALAATLAGLEHRLASWPDAAAYVRAVRLARFSSGEQAPSLRQRRALRGALGDGLGVSGRVRALWALPPRWRLNRSTRPSKTGAVRAYTHDHG